MSSGIAILKLAISCFIVQRILGFRSWQAPNFGDILKQVGGKQENKASSKSVQDLEKNLLKIIKERGATSDIVKAFLELEKKNPAPPDVLNQQNLLQILDGSWFLQYTISAKVGEPEKIEDTGVQGVVNASGINVEASAGNVPIQTFNISNNYVGNTVKVDVPILGTATVKVCGKFTVDRNIGRRAIVQFERLELLSKEDTIIFSAEWPFRLQRFLRPELANGDEKASWLDTTYLSETLRLGRGNKGSIFVLEKV